VQLVLPLNAHEPQPSVRMQGPTGRVVLTIQNPRRRRWDFASSRFMTAALRDVDLHVEVHVTDRTTGGHGVAVADVAPA
jgi:hypothetical protein